MIRVIMALVMLSLIIGAPAAIHAQDEPTCTLTLDENAIVYSAPSNKAEVLAVLDEAAEFDILLAADHDWVRLLDEDGHPGGWVVAEALDPDCETELTVTDEQPDTILLQITGSIAFPRVNVRMGPSVRDARVGRLVEGDEVSIIAQTQDELPWYLIDDEALGLVWVRSDLVHFESVEGDVVVVALPESVTPPASTQASRDNPADTLSSARLIVGGNWTLTSTLLEHGCTLADGPQPGDVTVMSITLTPAEDDSSVTLTYASGTSNTLYRGSGITYTSSFTTSASIYSSLTFSNPAQASGSQVVIHPPNAYRDTECVIRFSWSAHKS